MKAFNGLVLSIYFICAFVACSSTNNVVSQDSVFIYGKENYRTIDVAAFMSKIRILPSKTMEEAMDVFFFVEDNTIPIKDIKIASLHSGDHIYWIEKTVLTSLDDNIASKSVVMKLAYRDSIYHILEIYETVRCQVGQEISNWATGPC